MEQFGGDIIGGFCPGGFCLGNFVQGGFVRGDFLLEPARSVLKWPTPSDEVWIARRNILCLIPEPVPTKITASRIGCKLQEAVFSI